MAYMDANLYKAAKVGKQDILRTHADQLQHSLTPDKNTILHIFITSQTETTESPNSVEDILQICKPLLTQTNVKGETPLHMAARYGHAGIVQVLIQHGKALPEDIESGVGGLLHMLRRTNAEKDTALHEAVRYNHLEVVKILTKEDPDFSYSINHAGESPLYMAVERGYKDVANEILRTCKSPDFRGPLGRTAMHSAVSRDDEEMTIKLWEKNLGALITEVDQRGWTPLHYAAHFGHDKIAKGLLMFDKSMAYVANNVKKETALHIAAHQGNRNVIKEIISCCPDCCELIDDRGWNVLHFAAKSGHLLKVNLILEETSFSNLLNQKDKQGDTPLHLAAISFSEWFTAEKLLSNNRVDKMAFNKKNHTALDAILLDNKFPKPKDITDDLSSDSLSLIWKAQRIKFYGGKQGQRILHNEIVSLETFNKLLEKYYKDEGEKQNDELKRVSQHHLVVATLIATVTFAAGFTMPGGFKSNESSDQGSAILSKNAAFQAFVITDTMAMVLSISAVFIHLFLPLSKDTTNILRQFWAAFLLTISAMGFMTVAFMTGLYGVLEHSLGLAIATCVISCCFFGSYYFIGRHMWKYEIMKGVF